MRPTCRVIVFLVLLLVPLENLSCIILMPSRAAGIITTRRQQVTREGLPAGLVGLLDVVSMARALAIAIDRALAGDVAPLFGLVRSIARWSAMPASVGRPRATSCFRELAVTGPPQGCAVTGASRPTLYG